MSNNPLLSKYEEIYGKKEEPKPDYYKGEKSYAEELEELRDTSTIPCVSPPSVPISNTGITAANPYPKLTSYDTHSVEDSFLQIAEKVKNKEARVTSMSMNMEHYRRSVTFEVLLDT